MTGSSVKGPGGFQAFAEQRMAELRTRCSGRMTWPNVSVAAVD